jgi:hypothetical protein
MVYNLIFIFILPGARDFAVAIKLGFLKSNVKIDAFPH